MLWYPSVGSKGYLFSSWHFKYWEFSWDLIEVLERYYDMICSDLRKIYKWPPSEMDNMSLKRLLKVYEEAAEEESNNPKRVQGVSNYRGM
jgi:hypothetical protein